MLRGFLAQFPFRTKILLYAAFVGTISLVLASAAFLIHDSVTLRKSFAEVNRGRVEILAHTCASAVGFQDPDFANRVLAGLAASPEVTLATIYLADGSTLAEYRRQGDQTPPKVTPDELTTRYHGEHLDTTMPITFQGLNVGQIYVRAEIPDLRSRLGRFGLLVLVIAILSLLLSLILARSSHSSLTQPVRALEATARAVIEGHDYTIRAEKINDDELGQLTDAFNDMLAQIQAREGDLKDSENRFSGLLNRLGEAVFRMTVPDGVFEYCSPAAETVFGYTAADFLKRPGILKEIAHPMSREYIEREHGRLLTGLAAAVWEYRIIDAEGKERWILQTNAVEHDEFGRVKALEGCCTDITQRREAALAQQQLELELQQAHKLEALGTLAGGIAHDFNNILEAIMGYTDLAAMDLPEDHPVQEFLEQVRLAGHRAAGMVRKILTFSRRGDMGKMPVRLNQVVHEAMELIRPSLPASIAVETSLPDDLPLVNADSNQIHQIVMNLCTNAGHAMENAGGQLRISLVPKRLAAGHPDLSEDMEPGSYLELTVADTGTGIDPAIRDRIFEPFFTTKPQGKGTGMGLAMVYGIVLDHGGNVLVESEPKQGTQFRILLPTSVARDDTVAASSSKPANSSGRVLFVDDEEMLVRLVERILGTLGYMVEAHTDPGAALAAFRQNPDGYDILVTDLTMPAMSGKVLATEILALRPDLPVIICTGYSREATGDTAQSLGIYAFAQKPLTMQQLGKLIDKALADSRQPKDS